MAAQEAELIKPPRTVRQYSDIEKAEALVIIDTCRGNVSEASRITGIPFQTLADWRHNRHGLNNDIPKLREFSQRDLSGKMEALAHKYAGLAYKKANKATVRDLITGMDKASTTMLLLRGQATSITETVERQELVVILQSALSEAITHSQSDVINVKPLDAEG